MTPEDLAAIREQNGVTSASRTLALCAALEAAWAERDRYRLHAEVNGKEVYGLYSHWRERAEVAEARMTDELIQLREALDLTDCRAERAETEAHTARIQRDNAMADYIRCDDALARVRALCDRQAVTYQIMPAWIEAVRAAIEGDSQ